MTAPADMSTPVTRGELLEELGQFEVRFDQKLERLEGRFDQKLERLEGRFDQKLELWGGALLDRIASGERRMTEVLTKAIESAERRMSADLARYVAVIEESMATRIAAIDDKYQDLPARVTRLETWRSGRRSR